jgi:uncharacterized 2Fe-2S/4Fe-4S cluster protein (DUF4445 family)
VADGIPISLVPLGTTICVPRGGALQDALFAQGVEFPCGGRGRCQGCRVRVVSGTLPVTPDDSRRLSPAQLDAGWRLACRARPETAVTLELAQWEAPILGDDQAVAFSPREGLGVAVDLGTTTLVAQLVDLRTGQVLGVRTALNAQAQHGGDIMSRIDFALGEGRDGRLTDLVRGQLGGLIADLLASAPAGAGLTDVVIVGNTVMHHLFCDVGLAPLAHHPFEPVDDGLKTFTATELGWFAAGPARVHFLPGLGGFVGSDILAGILATGLHESERPGVLVDLGTNGEIVVGNRDRLLCASTAAGPAFEGARISQGMRAATGAISAVAIRDGGFAAQVLGGGEPRGICGSGLVDAVACGLELGRVQASGRITGGGDLPVLASVRLTQRDIRELQLAKGAIAAGIRLLIERWGTRPEELTRVWLAGAFGNYISRASARRIGLIDFPVEQVEAAGNTALRGAKLALVGLPQQGAAFDALRARTRHLPLNDDPQFHEVYVDAMGFSATG